LGGALEARGIDAAGGKLRSEAEGEVFVEDRILVLKNIHVRYILEGCQPEKREAAIRAHEHHASRCPVARSIEKAIAITTEIAFV